MAIVKYPEVSRTWESLEGKPYPTISYKGIANGLSDIPNDGADFGVDTTEGATSPSQTGAPYSSTLGIMEAINSLPKIYNVYTQRYVPIGRIFLKNGLYVITQPIITYEDWMIMIEGEQPPSEPLSSGEVHSVKIVGANDIGVLLTLTANITSTNDGVYGGEIYLKNLELYDNYTDSNGTYHQYNYSTGYTDLKGHVINYLIFSCYSTPDAIVLDNVIISFDNANSSDYNSAALIYTNTSELYVQFRGSVTLSGSSQYHPAFTLSSLHFIVDALDIGSNVNPTTYTQFYPAFPAFAWMNMGERNFIAALHLANSIFPLWAAGNNGIIGTLLFEVPQPPLGTNGQPPICGNVTDSLTGFIYPYANFGIAGGALLTVENWIAPTWNPLLSGFLPSPLAGGTLGLGGNAPYLQILQMPVSALGLPFNTSAGSNTGWSCQSASSPTTGSLNYGGIKLPANIGFNNYTLSLNPSVPASGVAQQNTNTFPVEVYLYGGTVTQIQISKHGITAGIQTVFSNATGLALSGQGYLLNPSDSITITYTTAPTWTWLPAG